MSINTIELLRNALLMGVLLLLVYILYKRMLRILGKDEISQKFPRFENKMVRDPQGNYRIVLEIKRSMDLSIEIFREDGILEQVLGEKKYEPGIYEIDLPVRDFPSGRYYYKLRTQHEEVSQYFEVT